MTNETLISMVNEMKMKERKDKNIIFKKINEEATLTGKCVNCAIFNISTINLYGNNSKRRFEI